MEELQKDRRLQTFREVQWEYFISSAVAFISVIIQFCRVTASNESLCCEQSKQWVKWVSFLDGSWVDALVSMTDLHIYRKHYGNIRCWRQLGRHFGAFNARHIITSQRNLLFSETVEALSIVLHTHTHTRLTALFPGLPR